MRSLAARLALLLLLCTAGLAVRPAAVMAAPADYSASNGSKSD
jgi:hypothetical protein